MKKNNLKSSGTRGIHVAVRGLVLALSVLSSTAGWAATTYWDPNGPGPHTGLVSGGPGTWNKSNATWRTSNSGGGFAQIWTAGNIAFFTNVGGTITVGEAMDIGGLSFDSSNFNLTGSTLTGTATNNVLFVDPVSISASVATVLAGTQPYEKTGAGTLKLSGVNSLSGTVTISGGKLLGSTSGTDAGALASATSIVINNTGVLSGDTNSLFPSTTTPPAITINTGGKLTSESGSTNNMRNAVTLAGGEWTSDPTPHPYGVSWQLRTGTSIKVTANSTMSATRTNIDDAGNQIPITVDAGVTLTNSGYFMSLGGIEKKGAGTMTMSGANTYTGATTVSAGTLSVVSPGSLSSGATTVKSGATLGGTGTLNNTVTIQSGGTLAPGLSPGTITMSSLVMNSGAVLSMELGQAGVVGGSLNDKVQVNGNLTLSGGTVNLSQSSGGALVAGRYRLIDYTGICTGCSGTTNLVVGTVPAGMTASQFTIEYVTNQVNLLVTDGTSNYWDVSPQNNSAVNGGTGTWQAPGFGSNTNWTTSGGAANSAWTDGSTAIFADTAGTVTVDTGLGAVNMGGLTFNVTGYTVQGGTLTGTAANNVLTVAAAGVTATVSSVLAGSNTFEKQGAGTLVLKGTSTYTGATSVTAGTLQLGDGTTNTASIASASSIAIGTGATLAFLGNDPAFSGRGQLISNAMSGAGTLQFKGNGTSNQSAYRITTANTLSGSVVVGAGARPTIEQANAFGTAAVTVQNNGGLYFRNAGTVANNVSVAGTGWPESVGRLGALRFDGGSILSGTVTLTANSRFGTYSAGDTGTISGVVSGAFAVEKSGDGTLTLSGANTYGGTTTVSAGSLKLGANGTLPSTSATTVASGATLDLNDKTQSLTTLTSSGTLALGSAGTGSLTLTSGASSIGAISGKGTITVNSGATLTLTSALSNNTDVNIVLAGGKLNLGAFTHVIGTLTVSADSTLDFDTGTAKLSATNLAMTAAGTQKLTVTGWTKGTDVFQATQINGVTTSPNRNAGSRAPLNRITMTGSVPAATVWLADPQNEITTGVAQVKVQKVTTGGFGGPFSFTQTNLASAPGNITTTAAGTAAPASPTAINATAVGVAVTITETPVSPYTLSSVSCIDELGVVTGNTSTNWATMSGNVLTIPAANVIAGSSFNCVLTNQFNSLTHWDGVNTTVNAGGSTTGGDGGTSTWNATRTNWTSATGTPNGIWDNNSSATAIFEGSAGTVTVNNAAGAINIGGLTFNTTGYTVQSGALTTTAATTLTAGAGISATVSSLIQGSNSVTKAGAGTIELSADNTFSGAAIVNGGTLSCPSRPNNTATSGCLNGASSVTVNNGATLRTGGFNGLWGFNRSTWAPVTVNAGGTLTTADNGDQHIGGTLTLAGGTLSSGLPDSYGSWLFDATSSVAVTADSTMSATNMVLKGGLESFTVDPGVTLTVSGNFSGSTSESSTGGLEKKGAGTMTMSGANTYVGATLVSAGKLQLGANGALPTSSATTVASGATLDLNSKTQTLSAGLTATGTLALGTGGALTLSAGSSTIAGANVTGSGKIIVQSGATLTLTSALANNSNSNVEIELAGGKLNLGAFTHVIGTLTVSADSTLDFDTGTAKLSTTNLAMTAAGTQKLTVSGWTKGTDVFQATQINGSASAPVRNVSAAPLNRIALTGSAAAATVWTATTATPANEITTGTATVKVQKTTVGSVGGPFSFTQTNLASAPASITTTAASTPTPASPTAINVTTPGTAVKITESAVSPYTLSSVSCIDANGSAATGTGNGSANLATMSGNELTIPAGNVVAGADFTCVFTNQFISLTHWDGVNTTVNAGGSTAGGDGGTSTWNTTGTNWTSATGTPNGIWDNGGTATAVFEGSAGTVTVDNTAGALNIGGLNFSTSGYTLSGGTLTGSAATNTLTVASGGTATISSVLAGGRSNAFVKDGAGTLTLSGANTYRGSTTVSAGTLSVTGSIAAGNAEVSVASGATLIGTGTISGDVTMGGGTLSPGVSGPGTLRMGYLSFSAASTVEMQLGSPEGASTVFASDLIQVDQSLGGYSSPGDNLTFNISNAPGGTLTVGTYPLVVTGAGYQGLPGAGDIALGTLPAGFDRARARLTYNYSKKRVELIIAPFKGTHWDGANTTVNAGGSTTGGDGGTSTWNTTATNWTSATGTPNGIWDNGGTATAIFEGSAGTVTVDNTAGAINIGGLNFSTSGYTLTGGTLTGSAATNTLTVASGGTATIASELAGGSSNTFVKDGAGTLTLSGANTYTGQTTVSAGTLSVTGSITGGGGGAGSAVFGGEVVVANGATLIGTGMINALVRMRGGTLSPGLSGPGTLTMRQLGFGEGTDSTVEMQLGSPEGFSPVNASDLILADYGISNSGSSDLIFNISLAPGTSTLARGTYPLVVFQHAGCFGLSGSGTGAYKLGSLPAGVDRSQIRFECNNRRLELTYVPFEGTYWDGGTTNQTANSAVNDGPGTWNTTTQNWTTTTAGNVEAVWDNTGDKIAVFGNPTSAGTPGSVVVSDPAYSVKVGGMTFGKSGYALSGDEIALGAASVFTVTNAADSASIGNVLSGSYSLEKKGLGTLTLSGANTYTGATTVSGGTLKSGINAALPSTSATTVASGATLDLNDKTQSLTTLTSSGTLALGSGGTGSLTLTSGASSIGVITGKGTIIVNSGATLTLTSALSNNTDVNIELAGGKLNLGAFTHVIGTLTVSADSTLDFDTGTAKLSATNLAMTAAGTQKLTVTNWTKGTDVFQATQINGSAITPNRNAVAQAPLNRITMTTGGTAAATVWTAPSATPANEITTGGATVKVQTTTTTGSGGPFSFTQTNLASAPADITTTAAATPTPASPTDINVTTLGTAVTITETPASPYTLSSVSCIDANGTATGNGNGTNVATMSGNVLTIPAGKVLAGADFTCVFTNQFISLTHWDGANTTVNAGGSTAGGDGGTSTWNTTATNWTSATGTPNGIWDNGGTATAIFEGSAGTVTVDNSAGAINIGGLNFSTSGYTLSGGTLTGSAATNTLTVASGTATISSELTGGNSNDFVKDGAGTLTLSGASNYTGTTTISAGTLSVTGSVIGAIPADPTQYALQGPFVVSAGATLIGTGRISAKVRMTGGTLAPGVSGPGTLRIGSLSFNAASTVEMQLGSPEGASTVFASDLVQVDDNIGTTANPGNNLTFNISNAPGGTLAAGTYPLVVTGGGYQTLSGSGDIALGTLPAGFDRTRARLDYNFQKKRIELIIAPFKGTYWDSGTTDQTPNSAVNDGAGTWNTTTQNWTTTTAGTVEAVWDNTGDKIAVFGNPTSTGTPGSVVVSDPDYSVSVGGMTFGKSGYTLSGDDIALGAASVFTVTNAADSASIGNVLSGSYSLEKKGAGTLTLSGANTYTGATTVTAGTLIAANAAALGTTAGATTVASGASLGLQASIGSEALTLSGTGVSSAGALYNASGSNTASGAITLAAAATIKNDAATTTLTLGTVGLAGFGATFDGAAGISVGGAIAGTGAGSNVSKAGTGTTTLSAANTYAGTTTVSGGTLKSGINAALPSTSATTVASGATLDLDDKTQSLTTLTSSGTLALGSAGTGSLTLTSGASSIGAISGKGTITVNSGATLTLTSAINSADVNIVLAGGTLNLGAFTHVIGTLTVSATGSTLDFDAGTAQITTSTLAVSNGAALNVTHWTRGTDKFYATAFTGAARNTIGAVPMNQITMTGYAPAFTVWQSDNEVNVLLNPRLRIGKTSNGGVGTFNFALTGLSATTDSITTTVAGTQVLGASGITGTSGTAATLTESSPSGWPANPASASCVDANGGNNANGTGTFGTQANNVLTVPAAKMIAGADITCSFVNGRNALAGVVFNDGGAPASGANTGTPNDGLKNGNEAGLPTVTVALTDCSATTYTSTTTDSSGAFSLNIPGSVTAGSTVCLTATSPTGYSATGANVAGTAVPDGTATTVGGTAYTYSRASQRLSFASPAGGSVQMSFGMVPVSTFVSNGTRQGAAGSYVVYAHTFTPGTGGALGFSIASEAATPANPNAVWSGLIYADPGCTGTWQSGAAQLYPATATTTVVQGQQVCVVVKEQIPAAADNAAVNVTTVRALLNFGTASPALSATYTLTDTTTVGNSALQLTKEVRNLTTGGPWTATNQAKSGHMLEYRVTYINNGPSPMTKVVLVDLVPAYTSFVSASATTTPAGLGNCTKNTPANAQPAAAVACSATQAVGGTGALRWGFDGALNPGATGEIGFQVQVD